MKVFPIIKPTLLCSYWPLLKEGFTVLQEKGRCEETLDMVLKNLFHNVYTIYFIADDNDKYTGFLALKVVQEIYKDKQVNILVIQHHYQKEKSMNKKMNADIQTYIDNVAIQFDCSFLKMYTKRKADRYLKELGYSESYTEYVKPVQGE